MCEDKLQEIDELYDSTMNTSYIFGLITPRSSRTKSYEKLITEYETYLNKSLNLSNDVLTNIYTKLTTLYEYMKNPEKASEYKVKMFDVLDDDKFNELFHKCSEEEFVSYMKQSVNPKRYYVCLMSVPTLRSKYVEEFTTRFEDIDCAIELFTQHLGTPKSKVYGDIIIKCRGADGLEYVKTHDTLPSNIDYYINQHTTNHPSQ